MSSKKLKTKHRQRLLRLAKKLETIPANKFNMDHWMHKDISDYNDYATREDVNGPEQLIKDCKTVACACGWGCTLPSFKKAGLRFDIEHQEIAYRNFRGYHAAAKFFGIDYYDADILFGPESYPQKVKPKIVAKTIRKFVEEHN